MLLALTSCVSVKPASAQYWDALWYEEAQNMNYPSSFAIMSLAEIKKYFSHSSHLSLLDLGAGTGRDSIFFANEGFKVHAVDFSSQALLELQNHSTITSQVEDFTQLKLGMSRYDVVYAHLSLHYFAPQQLRKILLQIKQALKKNGLFFIKVKSVNDWQYAHGKKVGRDRYIDGHVRQFYRVKTLRQVLDIFKIEKITAISENYHGRHHAFIEAIAVNQ